MKPIAWLLAAVTLFILGAGLFIFAGAYNVAADEPHWALTASVLEAARERSVSARASEVAVPDLADPSLVREGAGNYDAMCVGCHLRPGLERSEMSAGLNPEPPNLSKEPARDPARAFWVIKHGIRMTGMPAWGRSMEDRYIWGMVAFLQELPRLSEGGYRGLVDSSEGHVHGKSTDEAAPAPPAESHVHEDGSEHRH